MCVSPSQVCRWVSLFDVRTWFLAEPLAPIEEIRIIKLERERETKPKPAVNYSWECGNKI